MANPFFSGRIPPGLAAKVDAHLLTTGETRSELLIRLLRAEVTDNNSNNITDNIDENKNDDVLADLIARVQKLEEAIDNNSDNITKPTIDNKTDNIAIGLAFHGDDDKLDNIEKLSSTDDKVDNNQGVILQEDRIAVNLTPAQLTDLTKIHERKTVAKAKSKKLLDLGMICEIGSDLILTKSGEATLEQHGK